ncbi:MAG: hypothetical protein PHG83_00740 [Patescibacteria group bacterium]|nr:hypothetical protein [Patescibacteria group bacterium]
MILKIPLYILAQDNKLPKHQFMDNQTLKWMIKNKPKFNGGRKIKIDPLIIIKYLQRYSPQEKWFKDKILISSIHGQRHILRCIALAGILYNANLISGNINELCIVASLHDIRRKTDKEDNNHAKKAAIWVKKNNNLISEYFGYDISGRALENISTTILYHDKIKYLKTLNSSLSELIDNFKMIDALDRYRQPKIKWWLNEDYLKIKPDCFIKRIAFELVVRSEKYALIGFNNKKSVYKSIYDIL